MRRAAAASAAFMLPGVIDAAFSGIAHGARHMIDGFGPLKSDPHGLLDLPAGFQYQAMSMGMLGKTDDPRFSGKLDNADFVPALHDGMGVFRGPRGVTILVRNHELDPEDWPQVDPRRQRRYDPLGTGGTTTLWVDRDGKLLRSFASLAGTFRNCAGGSTPWGSWLSAEECTYMPGPEDRVNRDMRPDVSKPHGYIFEVDAYAEELVEPTPIRTMGRFYHEALAVDPVTGFVYLTEDRNDGLLYRFRPDVVVRGRKRVAEIRVGDMAKGGVLEAMRVPSRPGLLTQNWKGLDAPRVSPGKLFAVNWVEIPDREPEMDETIAEVPAKSESPRDSNKAGRRRKVLTALTSTRAQGHALGCAQFARTEGITYQAGSVYFCCTNGGRVHAGQVWKLDLRRGQLSLALEADNRAIMDGPDNIAPSPMGDLVICEDGREDDRVLGLTPSGAVYEIARNAYNNSEMAGACFAPDGHTLFVNMQEPGITFAIRGPWKRGAR
jgi:secreted PhoX family phosphatase